jgi:uncharacterized protein (TIGR03437 family)
MPMSTLKNTVIAGSIILMAGCSVFAQQTVTATYTYNGLPLPILVDSADVITVATIAVPRAIKMTKVTAQIQIQYPNTNDLNVYLYSPVGTRVKVAERNCNVANIDTTFDDGATQRWSEACPTAAGGGPFRGNEPMSNFNNDNTSFGIWRLAVENNGSDSRTGWITFASLTITGTTQVNPTISSQLVVNSASVSGGGMVAPGEVVSILGVGLGPAPPVAAPAGALPTTLGGTTVNLNGNPAPILYTSAYRVDIQVPFSVAPGSTITATVNFSNQTSPGATLNVVTAVPGIYTQSTGGPGPVKAVNPDGTLNSSGTPAAKGSVIVVYASGMGAVDPAIQAGMVPPASPLSRVTGQVGAFIGGVPATVQYAGLAPGSPGLYQLNIQVPTSAPSGTQELLVYSSGVSTQKGATLFIQ